MNSTLMAAKRRFLKYLPSQTRAKRQRVRLALESLESRMLLAGNGITVTDWTLDLGGVTGPKVGTVSGIDRIGFINAINHVTVTKAPGNLELSAQAGDTAVIRGAIRATSLEDDLLGPLPDLNLNGVGGPVEPWEITAVFQANVEFLPSNLPGQLNFRHTGGLDTFLKIYADEYGANGLKADLATALGYGDGNLVAAFDDSVTGGINTFNSTSLNGSDDATFLLDVAASAGATTGILFDMFGNDLVANALNGGSPALSELNTDENFDAVIPSTLAAAWTGASFGPTSWTTLFPAAVLPTTQGDLLNFFTLGDGSAVLATEVDADFHGCTPGFWKSNAENAARKPDKFGFGGDPNDPLAWHATGIAPTDTLASVGFVGFPAGTTFEQALNTGGGGENALMRHAAAAYLNAAHPAIAYEFPVGSAATTGDIVTAVNAALASMDAGTIEDLKDQFDESNNAGCNINQFGEVEGSEAPVVSAPILSLPTIGTQDDDDDDKAIAAIDYVMTNENPGRGQAKGRQR